MTQTQMPFPDEPQKFPSIAPATQIAAFIANAPMRGKQRRLAYAALQILGRATDEQIWTYLVDHELISGTHNSIGTFRARRIELVAMGYVIDSGEVYEGSTVWMIGEPDDPAWLDELNDRKESIRIVKKILLNRGPVGDDLAKRLSVYIAKNYEE